ncbi:MULTISPECIES: MBL fold metallo-hydrolase [unclassified Mesorhizobium]|uniref:MBL fold metallo-hydrolase n=1 Tax=unclassified Mesorhizobium TaxID=325217 RepID=UPI0010933958|nr:MULTISPECIES: MBL fold metallo-hydrolase [unclassified Mesorhizobium]TGQ77279.1 MBL fold metallo-hydrolase [Mesorhizobium sp. M8A.F.Ca.ET.207.01.1.1]TGS39033.1 MBL fold metallo-hydrolase [Mesorhizobium sp. M8A.F.Ca.ET.182.01.1.1]TGS77314.1 MBL fold metallo-hydrolase [Mesorhizobium sp. M8A.F.Ca.ET.181.01.1.1]TGT36304.1 MBL fold metallo-hydrolase [Mesorhizobium sp. M8A.F.Ca.ET.165.01.1.1]
MQTLRIGDVTITSIIERDGPWRRPEDMFPAYDPEIGRRHIAELDPVVFDKASGRMVITYQSFVVRTPKHTILVDTCTGDHKGYSAPMDFPKQPWLDGFRAAGLRFEDIDYVFCTHLDIDHCGWNTVLKDGRWVPTFPNAKYVFHKGEYAAREAETRQGDNTLDNVWRFNCEPIVEAGQALLVDENYELDNTVSLTLTPGHSPCHCCVNIRSRGQSAVVTGDLFHHALQCREPEWSTNFDWDPKAGIRSRRNFLASVAGTGTLVLPIHFPNPTVGRIEADGDRFRYSFVR